MAWPALKESGLDDHRNPFRLWTSSHEQRTESRRHLRTVGRSFGRTFRARSLLKSLGRDLATLRAKHFRSTQFPADHTRSCKRVHYPLMRGFDWCAFALHFEIFFFWTRPFFVWLPDWSFSVAWFAKYQQQQESCEDPQKISRCIGVANCNKCSHMCVGAF